MKVQFLNILFLYPFFIYGQNISTGNYCDHLNECCLELHQDSIFLFQDYYNLNYGCGNYSIKGQIFELQFSDYDKIFPPRYIFNNQECNNSDSVKISFNVIDDHSKIPIHFVEIKISKSSNFPRDKTIAKETNFAGKVCFDFRKNNTDSVWIHIWDYKWEYYSILLKTSLKECNEIDIFMLSNEFGWVWTTFANNLYIYESKFNYLTDSVKTFEIIKEKNKKFILKNLDTGVKWVFRKHK
ncbi:MAG: hypothetical protein DRJ05_17860 [Bacteroidetes bacterium]|nr:MAG: hypothetical protein DRJ05_17860 [Bacteroidota bacterium]